jgi:hypothetical protein
VRGEADEFSADDIVLAILQRVLMLVPEFNRAIADQIEAEIRSAYGGKKVRIPKRGKHLSAEQREALFLDGLSNMPTPQIIEKHRISRRTLERQMKRGGRFSAE